MNLVITMAGAGRRFRDAGYDQPKFAIRVKGRSLFTWAMQSLDAFLTPAVRAIFVARAGDAAADFVAGEMAAWPGVEARLVELDHITDGQATTALIAAAHWDEAAPLLIYNIDTHVNPRHLRPQMIAGEGWIPCFRAAGEHWSFVRTDAHGRALEVAEKRRISDLASIGLYWFASAALFARAYAETYESAGAAPELAERYVAPVYNALIAEGRAVTVTEVPAEAVVPLGTPAEVRRFEAECAAR